MTTISQDKLERPGLDGKDVSHCGCWCYERGRTVTIVVRSVVCGTIISAGILWTLDGRVALAEDWPCWRGPDHNGVSREADWDPNQLKDGPKSLWRKQIGTGFAAVAVSEGRVYAMGNTGQPDDKSDQDQKDVLWCFDAGTGNEVWKYAYVSPLQPKNHEGGPSATPTVEDGRVYTLSVHGHVLCIDTKNGAVVWQKHLTKDYGLKPHQWGFASSPLVVGSLVILNAGGYGTGLHRQDGTLVWVNDSKGVPGYGSAVPYEQEGKECVAMLGNRELFGLVAATGEILWKQPWKTQYDESIPDPIITGDELFMSSGLGTGAALFRIRANKLVRVWSNKDMQNWMNSSVLSQGYVYGVDTRDGALKCLELRTGATRWSHEGLGVGSVMLAGDKLVALSDKGELIVARAVPDAYHELASASILTGKCWTMPVLSGGRIYARNATGDLVCVDVSSKK
jgi:outer membrane protein assembly factor BamB